MNSFKRFFRVDSKFSVCEHESWRKINDLILLISHNELFESAKVTINISAAGKANTILETLYISQFKAKLCHQF